MAKRPSEPWEVLRKHAGRASGARWEEALEDLDGLSEQKTATEEAAEALDEFDTITHALTRILEALGTLVEFSLAPQAVLDSVNEALTLVEEVNGVVSPEDLRAFAEAYDDAHQNLESYGDTKAGDRYDGKREDLESQWEEAVATLDQAADAYEAILSVEEPTEAPDGLSEAPGTTVVLQAEATALSESAKVQP